MHNPGYQLTEKNEGVSPSSAAAGSRFHSRCACRSLDSSVSFQLIAENAALPRRETGAVDERDGGRGQRRQERGETKGEKTGRRSGGHWRMNKKEKRTASKVCCGQTAYSIPYTEKARASSRDDRGAGAHHSKPSSHLPAEFSTRWI